VIDHGRKIADDTPANLKAEHASDRITLTFDNAEQAKRVTTHHSLGIAEGASVKQTGTQVVLEMTGGAQIAPKLLRSLDDALIEVASVEVARPTLDDVFLNLTGRSLREDVSAKGQS
jgi:ABC-2 type transport system ATP-binding protein